MTPAQVQNEAAEPQATDQSRRPLGLVNVLGFVGLGLLGLGVFGLGLHNLGNRYFWTDESSSFFTALGWPAPGQQPGGFAAIQQTLITFLDPGLYHLMIRGWSELFGTSIQALRALPFTFFIIYIVALLLWYRRLKLPLIVAVAGVSIMMLDNITPYYAVEVRAYSASLAAAVVLPLAALWFLEHVSVRRLVIFLAVGLFFGAMQYTAASANVATAALLAVGAFRQTARQQRLLAGLAGGLMLVWLPLIHLVTRGWPSGGAEEDLDHVRTLVLAYMDSETLLHTLTMNFFSFTALPRTLFLVIVPLVFLAVGMSKGKQTTRAVSKPSRDVRDIWLYVLTLTVTAALLSAGGFLPWVLGTRWSITEIAGIALSVLGGFALVKQYAPRTWSGNPTLKAVGALALIVIVMVGTWRLWSYERPGDSKALDELVPVLVSGNPEAPILIDYWIFPDTRYWVEYSGEFDQWRDEWINRGVISTDGYVKAGPESIQKFIDSPSDRMLLKDTEVLEQMTEPLPASVRVVYPSEPDFSSPDLASAPVVLVKEGSSSGS